MTFWLWWWLLIVWPSGYSCVLFSFLEFSTFQMTCYALNYLLRDLLMDKAWIFFQQPQTKHHFYKHHTLKDKVCVLLIFFFALTYKMYRPGLLTLPSLGFVSKVFGEKGEVEFVWLGPCLCAHSESDRNEPLVAYYGLTQETIGILWNSKLLDPTRAGEHQGDVMGDWHEKLRSHLASCVFLYREQFFYPLWFLPFWHSGLVIFLSYISSHTCDIYSVYTSLRLVSCLLNEWL